MRKIMGILIGALAVVSILLIVFLILPNLDRDTTTTTTTTTSPTIATTTTTVFENNRLIENIDRNIETVSENPDLIFEETWSEDDVHSLDTGSKFVNIYQAPESFYPWFSNGSYSLENYSIITDRIGVVSIHPNPTTPTYLGQNITLDNDDYIIVATIANTANYRPDKACYPCSDSIFIIKIIDLVTGLEEKIYEDVIDSTQGWQTIYLDISDYKNKDISLIIEAHDGGPCGYWCAEYATVDEFYIGRLE